MARFELNPNCVPTINDAAKRCLAKTAEALHTEVVQAQVVPRDTGLLQNEAFFVDLSELNFLRATLTHQTPYARRLYFHPEYNFKRDKNPNTKGMWFNDWLPGGKKQNWANDAFAEFMRRELP